MNPQFAFDFLDGSSWDIHGQAANVVRPDPLGGTRLFPLIIVAIVRLLTLPVIYALLIYHLYRSMFFCGHAWRFCLNAHYTIQDIRRQGRIRGGAEAASTPRKKQHLSLLTLRFQFAISRRDTRLPLSCLGRMGSPLLQT